MREILFRAKRRDEPGWAYGSLIDPEHFGCILEHTDGGSWDDPYMDSDLGVIDGTVTPIIPCTIGQFTGLVDKNGEKIFEGDILKCEITYDIGCYPHTETEIREVKYRESTFTPLNRCDNSEVIGNIHDNPELLKKEKYG